MVRIFQMGRGATPKEAFQRLRATSADIHTKESFVVLEVPPKVRPHRFAKKIMETETLIKADGAPLVCVLASPADTVVEMCPRLAKAKIDQDEIFIATDGNGNELFSSRSKEDAICKGRELATQNKKNVIIRKETRIAEQVMDFHSTFESYLNSYWFFGYA